MVTHFASILSNITICVGLGLIAVLLAAPECKVVSGPIFTATLAIIVFQLGVLGVITFETVCVADDLLYFPCVLSAAARGQ